MLTLTGFQLRAARAVLDIYGKDLAQELGLHHSTLIRLEYETPNLQPLKCYPNTSKKLISFFESQQIIFPDPNSIALNFKTENDSPLPASEIPSLTRFQLKAARIGMRLTQDELGEQINFHGQLISRLEIQHQNYQYLKAKEKIISALWSLFMENGITLRNSYKVILTRDLNNLIK